MTAPLLLAHLWAQQIDWEGFSSAFRGDNGRGTTGYVLAVFIIIFGVIALMMVLFQALKSDKPAHMRDEPWRLFFRLCRAHRLRWIDWWLLFQVARYHRLRDPACLFLQPQRLDPANLDPQLRTKAARLLRLREQLFAGPAELKKPPRRQAARPATRSRTGPSKPAKPSSVDFPATFRPGLDAAPWDALPKPADDAAASVE
ncbi:MAG: hypothetical protein HQ581_24670 [Planctomycetes bacterium]|nr:hypothetical protein [Planctomycetota bacterium]